MNFDNFFPLKWSLINLKDCEIKLFEPGIKNFQQLKTNKPKQPPVLEID